MHLCRPEPPPHNPPPMVPIGKIKTFGAFGPMYEVREPLYRRSDGEWMVKVLFVRTSEVGEYPLSALRSDPDAR